MKVKHYMTKEVVTITSDRKITDAVDLMESNNFHRLPVVDEGKFTGLITEKIIAENSPSKVTSLSIYEMNYLFDKVLVKDIMVKNVTTISEEALIEEAAQVMVDNDLTVLPVLDDQRKVIGIITHKDIFKALVELTGYKDEGARILVETPVDCVGIFAEISNALATAGINLTHVFVNYFNDHIEITIQTSDSSGEKSCQIIEELGYVVYQLEK